MSDKPKLNTYIDDNFVLVTKFDNLTLQQALDQTINKIEQYMANNMLLLNTEKTKLMVLSCKPSRRLEIKIPSEPKDLV